MNAYRIHGLRYKRQGDTAVIVGNGPSLCPEDLDRTIAFPSFACNHIGLIFEKTTWRPTYYVLADPKVAKKVDLSYLVSPAIKLLMIKPCAEIFPEEYRIIRLEEKYGNERFGNELNRLNPELFQFSTALSRGVQGGWTTLYTCLQIAYCIGFKKIILLGVDHNYDLDASHEEKSQSLTHFSQDYGKLVVGMDTPRLDITTIGFWKAAQEFQKIGGGIVNCSRRTKLECIPRRSLEDAIRDVKNGSNLGTVPRKSSF